MNIQVKSIVVPYETIYLRRIMEVMEALHFSRQQRYREDQMECTYKDPMANMKTKTSLFFRLSVNPFNS